jgi:DNA-binding IclR family transcriptional regulator
MTAQKNTVEAVRTSFRILETLQQLGTAGATEIASRVGVSKGAVHNHLSTLRHEEYVVRTDDGEYQIGFRFLDLAHSARQRVDIYDLVAREVDKLAEETGEMALYTREEHGLGVCLYRTLGANSVETPLYVGHRSHLHHTAVGKAILAHKPPEYVKENIEQRGLPKQTEATITDADELLDQLQTVREEGTAFNRGETIPGLVGVGAPIIDQNNDVNGAISVIGPTSRMSDERLHGEISDLIARSVNIIGINATSL